MTKQTCTSIYFSDNRNGTATRKMCGLTPVFCHTSSEKYNSAKVFFCPVHLDEFLKEEFEDIRYFESGKDRELYTEVLLEELTYLQSQGELTPDLHLSFIHQMAGYEVDKVLLHNIKSAAKLDLSKVKIKSHFFIKNSNYDKLELNFIDIPLITIVNSNIGTLILSCNGEKAASFWINKSNIGVIRSNLREIQKFRIESSHIYNSSFMDNKFIGDVVVLRSIINFSHGDFSNARIGVADKVTFSSSTLDGCNYLSRIRDEWRELKFKYSGNSATLLLMLFAVYVSPLVFHMIFWKSINDMQAMSSLLLESSNINIDLRDESLINYAKCLSTRCREVNIFSLLIGSQKGIFYMLLSVTLLVFNILRMYMVHEVAVLRDLEELSGRYPKRGSLKPLFLFKKKGPQAETFFDWRFTYYRLVILDKVLSSLMYVSLLALFITLYNMYETTIFLPL